MARTEAASGVPSEHLLDHLVEHAPAEYRASMFRNVRLHREVLEAWKEFGVPWSAWK